MVPLACQAFIEWIGSDRNEDDLITLLKHLDSRSGDDMLSVAR